MLSNYYIITFKRSWIRRLLILTSQFVIVSIFTTTVVIVRTNIFPCCVLSYFSLIFVMEHSWQIQIYQEPIEWGNQLRQHQHYHASLGGRSQKKRQVSGFRPWVSPSPAPQHFLVCLTNKTMSTLKKTRKYVIVTFHCIWNW